MGNDLPTAVREHCDLFNQCVESGDWTPFFATFTEDATLTLIGLPVGPFVGRPAIAAAYTARPPAEPMRVQDVTVVEPSIVEVRYHWESGTPGAMRVSWRGEQVCAVEVSAGASPS